MSEAITNNNKRKTSTRCPGHVQQQASDALRQRKSMHSTYVGRPYCSMRIPQRAVVAGEGSQQHQSNDMHVQPPVSNPFQQQIAAPSSSAAGKPSLHGQPVHRAPRKRRTRNSPSAGQEVASSEQPAQYPQRKKGRKKKGEKMGAFKSYICCFKYSFKGKFNETTLHPRTVPAAAAGNNVPTAYTSLPPPTICSKCGAKKFKFESEGFCCAKGQVKIVSNEYPESLMRLFTGEDDDALHFQQFARLYNCVFAFSSLGGVFDANLYKGIYVFKLCGQIYHYLPNLLPNGERPKYLQLYFYDAQNEKKNRLEQFNALRETMVTELMALMETNPYSKFFKRLQTVNVEQETRIVIQKNTVLDQRVFNAPTSEDVAGVWYDSCSSSDHKSPYIVVHGKSDKNHQLKHYYGCYDPLSYPLLFPQGECGWHQGIKKESHRAPGETDNPQFPVVDVPGGDDEGDPEELLAQEAAAANGDPEERRQDVSCREYYAYTLQIRPGNFKLRTCRLFQQFVVDMYVKIENTRLDFFRRNQTTIRADLYQGILDTVQLGEKDSANVGHPVILPPSFIGGPRDMKRRYLNSMALVQKYGKPDLFLTMTCNPNWPEIQAELAPGELACNRPDVVARIFRAKLVFLKHLIMKKEIFGEVAGIIHVVEFQKRGLPHAHILIILKPGFKITSPEDFDKFVCAEIPSDLNLYLLAAVLKHMMHGPCGPDRENCPCMVEEGTGKVCKNSYPRNFSSFTTTSDDSYPIYRRRNTGEVFRVRGADMDNRWVVPYNPYLLAMFDCHINLEVCSTVKAVKYLYKYVYKGHDRVAFNVVSDGSQPMVNEIDMYQAGRWVSPPEAAWRIFGFELFSIFPAVMPLQVHMPNMQYVQFSTAEELPEIAVDERRSKTMLTEFFAIHQRDPEGPKYLYSETPLYFSWKPQLKRWAKRKQRLLIGRLTYASPAEGERYYLRMLLANVLGPRSFDDLLMVDGYKCATFQESALKRGLLEQDDSLDQCMEEAIQVQMPNALRRLFATILIFCQPRDPKNFWDKFYKALSEDYRRHFPKNEHKVLQLTAQKVEQYLEGMGKSFNHYGLDHLREIQDDLLRQTRDITDAIDAPIPEECVAARKQLNSGQRQAYKSIINCIKTNKPGAFFIDGPGGTGKTFLYCALYAKIRQMGKICIPTATSGIAASNIPSGRTAHSRFKIPLDSQGLVSCDIAKQSSVACLLKQASLIIWDEASMALKENIEALDNLLQDLCSNTETFGGKVVVFGGDFRQVLPVLPKKTQQEAVEASVVSSYLWPKLHKFRLTENLRARHDPQFAEFLLRLGNGELQSREADFVKVPQSVVIPWSDDVDSIRLLVETTFPEINHGYFSPQIFTDRTILTAKNENVDCINEWLIERFPGEPTIYNSFDSMIHDDCSIYPSEFLNTLCPAGMSPHELKLKENCPVILLRNIDPAAGLCNGTRLICKNFSRNMIQCQIATGCYAGEQVFLPRITLKPSPGANYPYEFQRRQFPIKLCFAMTINKAQGQTLQQVGVYLPTPCFSHGQLYVALSRARKSSQLKIMTKPPSEQETDSDMVKNVISFEVLRRADLIQ